MAGICSGHPVFRADAARQLRSYRSFPLAYSAPDLGESDCGGYLPAGALGATVTAPAGLHRDRNITSVVPGLQRSFSSLDCFVVDRAGAGALWSGSVVQTGRSQMASVCSGRAVLCANPDGQLRPPRNFPLAYAALDLGEPDRGRHLSAGKVGSVVTDQASVFGCRDLLVRLPGL